MHSKRIARLTTVTKLEGCSMVIGVFVFGIMVGVLLASLIFALVIRLHND